MVATYPLTFPTIGIQTSTFRLVRVVNKSTSPFTGEEQVYKYQGEWWEGEATFRTMRRSDAGSVQAFLAQLRGMYGTFLYGDPDALALGTQGVGGTIVVDGSSQTGNTLNVRNMTVSTNNILKAGDYFQLGTGTSSRLYLVTEALNSNSLGKGTINFEPALRISPTHFQDVIITSPKGAFRLAENTAEWSADQANLYSITISFREAL